MKTIDNFILKIKVFIYSIYYEHIKLPCEYKKKNKRAISIGKKERIKVVFFAMSLPMWKYQHLYDILKTDNKFELFIVLSPAITFTREKRKKESILLRDYFSKKGMPFIDFYDEEGNERVYDVRGKINPDIVFHTQPYDKAIAKEYSPSFYSDKLLCFYPYSYKTLDLPHNYKLDYYTNAWKLYYQNEVQYILFRDKNPMQGRNVVIVGYPKADDFFSDHYNDIWKPQPINKKRIIWAPHFTLQASMSEMQARSNFLMMADFMIKIAEQYKDRIQFAFKPHPRLLSELYMHPDWGMEKANKYYDFWRNSSNTQLEEGDFVDLFRGSDAIIHDSGSFLVDYMYVQKPAMFVTNKLQMMLDEADDFAKQVYDCYYIGKDCEEILAFVENTVLSGNDPLEEKRKYIFEHYLQSKDGKTVAQKTAIDLYHSLGLKYPDFS